MSKSVNDNAVGIYFKNLRRYIDSNVSSGGGVKFLKEIKSELLYLLLKNQRVNVNNNIGGTKIQLNKYFIQRCDESITYCDLLESKLILSEGVNKHEDPDYDEMVAYIKGKFGNDVDEFDFNGAIYYFGSHYHGGQSSNLYRAMSETGYNPGAMQTEPVDFADYEYTYLLYKIQYDIDGDGDDGDFEDSMRYVVKKSEIMQDDNSHGDMDKSDLENQMVEYISEASGYLVKNFEYRLISSKIVEHDNATMNSVYRALVNRFASVTYDVGGKHDDLPPGEHYDLPPGIKENKKNMNENTISIREVKNLINEVIAETLRGKRDLAAFNESEMDAITAARLRGDYDEPPDPQDSIDDFAGDHLDTWTDTVNRLIKQVETESGDYDEAYDRLVDIYRKLSSAIDNPRLSDRERKKMEHDYDGILGNIHRVISGGGGGAEKMYVAEALSDKNHMLISKWCESMGCRKAAMRMIDSILKSKLGLGADDLPDTSTYADGVDSVEQALEQGDYAGAYEIARDTAQSMIEDEGGDGLFECGSWNEAVKHPMFKEAVLSEKAPPGMEKWIKANKNRFEDQYGDNGIRALYATAWKMFYKKKNK
jgi:hypothetical protein